MNKLFNHYPLCFRKVVFFIEKNTNNYWNNIYVIKYEL